MRFMILVKANADSEAGVMPSTEILTAMGKFNEELVKAGVLLAGEGLHPSSKGVRVRCEGPTEALVFGDLNDPHSRVSKAGKDARAYKVLDHHLNTQPSVTYLKDRKYSV